MSNLVVGIKRFLTNKNTVTILGVIIAMVVLYLGYNRQVAAATNPVEVPYAKVTINPGVRITKDMIGYTKVPTKQIQGEVLTDVSKIINKFSNADSVIPKGSLFYARSVTTQEVIPGSIILDYPEGYVLYNFPIDTEASYGNNMFPGHYIDIYLKAINKKDEANPTNEPDKIMVGKLLQNVKILAVQDANGRNVFENLEDIKTPSLMIFAVPEEYHILLRKASYLRTYDTTLIPVPTAESLKDEPGEVSLSSEELKDFINRVTVWTES